MADFMEKLSSFSTLGMNDGVATPAPMRIEIPQALVPSPEAPAVPTQPVEAYPLPAPVSPEVKHAQDVAQIDAFISDPVRMAMANVSRERGNDLTAGNNILNDRKSMNEVDFIRKYGDDVYQKVMVLDAGRGHLGDLSAGSRSVGEIAQDVGVGVASGAIQGIGSLAALALSAAPGPLNKKAAVAVSETLAKIKEASDGMKSKVMQRHTFVDGLRGALDKQDNANAFESDKKSNGELVASLRNFGREVVSGGSRLIEDPMMLESGVSEAGGSLLIGGPVAKGVGALAKGAGRLVTSEAAALSGAAQRAATSAIDKAAMPLTIGGMEAGGSYTQTIQEVMGVADAELMKTSSAYKQLRDSGVSERDAKVEVATRAGNIAAALTFPVAALSGTLVSKFESAPISGVIKEGPVAALGNVARETAEEGLQSATGQLAGNTGQRIVTDPNKNLSEGVGEQMIQGAIFGAGSAGVVQAPGLAARGLANTAKALAAPVVGAIADRADAIRARNEEASPVSRANVAPQFEQAAAEAPAVAEAVRSVVNDPAIAPEQHEAVQSLAHSIENAFRTTPEDIAGLDPKIQEGITQISQDGAANRFDAMTMAAMATQDQSMSQEARTNAALWLLDQKSRFEVFSQTGSELLGKLDHSRPEVAAFQQMDQVLNAVLQTKEMREALQWAAEKMAAPEIKATADLSVPENQAAVKTTTEIARLAPEKIDIASADVILRQDKLKPDARILTPSERQDLHAAVALALASEAHAEASGQAKVDRVSLVNREIEIDGGKGHKKSLTQHAFDINAAMKAGDEKLVREQMKGLALFARSMRNKAEAMNKAIVAGDRKDQPYRAAGPNGWLKEDGKQRVFYNPGTTASQNLAKQIQADARAVAALANSYAVEYPQYGFKEISIPALENERKIINNNQDTTRTAAEKVAEPVVVERGSSEPASKVVEKSQATTSETAPNPSQAELPLPVPETKSEPKPSQDTKPETRDASSSSDKTVEAPARSSTDTVPVVEEAKAPENVPAVPSTEGTQKTSEAFPSLIQPQGRNLFHEAFRFPREQLSNLMAEVNPLLWLGEIVNSLSDLSRRIGARVEPKQADALLDLMKLVDKAGDVMDTRLQGAKDLLDRMSKGEPVNRYSTGKVLNLVEPKGEGFAYHEQLKQAALAAGLDWLINGQAGNASQSREDLSSSLGIRDITSEMVEFFNRGVSLDQAKKQLAQRIVSFWGLETNSRADIAYTQGIPEAFASEMLHAFIEKGLIAYEMTDRFQAETGNSYSRVYFDMRSDEVRQLFAEVGPARQAISKIALINDRDALGGVSIGAPITEVSRTQLRNPGVAVTKQQTQALQNEQRVRYLPNLPMFDLVSAMGEDALVMLLAGRTNAEGLNVNHARSVDGKIRGLRAAFQNVTNQMAEIKAHAAANGLDAAEVPSFYRHEITRVGRLQMMGLANPQGDKLAREIFMPTRSELDLANAKHLDFFWLTVAQGLGVKTEQDARDVARGKAEALVAGLYAGIVADLKTWLESREAGKTKSLPTDLAQRIRDKMDGKPSMHGLHSLMSVAQLQIAQEKGELGKFTHFNYLEADGKTNGPINALMLLAPGRFTQEWLDAVRKGGVFFGADNLGKTLNSVANDGDLYGQGAAEHKIEMASLRQRLAGNEAVSGQMDAMLRVLSALNADISFDGTDVTIKRGVTKNPLTISIYGSGVDGIAGKVAGELIEQVYAKMSEFMASGAKSFEEVTYSGFWKDLQALAGQRAVFDRESNDYKLLDGYKAARDAGSANKTPENFTVQAHEFRTLKTNIRTLFVDPLSVAINRTVMGHVGETTDAVQQATQIQSIVMRGLYRRAVIEKLVDRKLNDPSYRNGDFLSEQDLRGIVRELMPMGPSISTGTQSYFLGGSEQGNILGTTEAGKSVSIKLKRNGQDITVTVPESFSRALTDDMRGQALIYGPSLAGVSSIPTVVIGSGDGQMMLNAATNPKIQGVLKVFDGMNMRADMIEEYSRLINESVHQTWTENPVRAVAWSFRSFLEQKPFDTALNDKDELNIQAGLMADVVKEMSKVLSGSFDPKELASRADIEAHAEGIAAQLDRIADEIDARQRVFKTFPMTVDQMASGETPFVQQGNAQVDGDVLVAMNLALEAKAEPEAPIVETTVAEPVVIEAKALTADIAGSFEKLDANEQEVLKASLKGLEESNYRVVMGSPVEVDAWMQANNGDRYQPGQLDGANGFVDPGSKIVVIANEATETTLHELIHAATYEKVAAYYADGKVSLAQSEAVQNLEALMQQWLALDLGSQSELAQTTNRVAVEAIRGHLNAGRKAAALNEFMAWVLSNQELAGVAGKLYQPQSITGIIFRAIKSLWDLIRGVKSTGPKVSDSMLTHIRFNTKILAEMPSKGETLVRDSAVTALFQSKTFGHNDRISQLRQQFHEKVTTWLAGRDFALTGDTKIDSTLIATEAMKRMDQRDQAFVEAHIVGRGMKRAGFLGTSQEQMTFDQILTGIALDVELNPNALSRIQDLYDHALKTLEVESFMTGQGDPQQDRLQAQDKLNGLRGLFGEGYDKAGRSSLLPAFLALAMVDEDFRGVLSNLALPKGEKALSGSTFDERLTNLGNSAMERLGRFVSGEGVNSTAHDTRTLMDRLMQSLIQNVGDTRSVIEQGTENGLDGAERYVFNAGQKWADKIGDNANRIINNNKSKVMRAGARVARAMSSVVSETQAAAVAEGVIRLMNKHDGLHAMREIVNDVVGRNAMNAPIYDMITKVRTTVQQTRQQFREQLPRIIASNFSRKLSQKEWSALHRGLAKTDLITLHEAFGTEGAIQNVLDDKRRARTISQIEKAIANADPRRAQQIQVKAKQLAQFMMSGEAGSRLNRNAYAVTRLVGDPVHARSIVDEGLVKQVDQLITLYALDGMDQGTKDAIANMATETQGFDFALSYLRGLQNGDLSKLTDPRARLNAYKGYMPSEGQPGVSMIVANDSEHAKLVKLGYERLGAYQGSSADRSAGRRSYYLNPVSGRAAYNQGVMQMVQISVGGIDPRTGFTVGELTAGQITDAKIVASIDRQLGNQRQTNEPLLPVYDENGRVVAFERSVDPAQLARLKRDTDLSRMIGVRAGRQIEEELAAQFNEQLIENLDETWKADQKAGRAGEYVNLAQLSKKDDAVLHEAWRLIPAHTKDAIKNQFGPGTFMVRRDQLNDAVGYRSASLGDFFTGNGRWSEPARKSVEDLALTMFGNKAFTRIVQTEKAVQDLVVNAKVLIVVKSVIVPAANLMSNIVQLASRGVPIRSIISGLGKKTAEINDYIRRRHQEIQLEAELHVARAANSIVEERRLESRIKTLRDSYKRMSIWPLIEAGEFAAISNGVVTAEDLALAEGRWGEWAERLATKVPAGPAQTLWRNAFITRDTALFQGLGKAVQYGDFLGKAILYEELTRRQKMKSEEAIARVGEAFVNYNRLAGRSRQYLESVGLLWFYNFKLRSIKEGLYMMRHHPLRSMLMMSLPGVSETGQVVTDNLLGVAAQGKLGYSIGPGMGMNAFSLNPWVNLAR